MRRRPELVVFCGPMWSGKTSALLSYVEKCRYQRRRVIAFKPRIDNRYSEAEIVSHQGYDNRLPGGVPAQAVDDGAGIIEFLANSDQLYDVIAVDELFMLKGAADTLIWAYQSGISVVVATLDLSADGSPFNEVKKLLPWATSVVKCTAACVICGEDAQYTYKKCGGEDLIEVGGEELYEPRCFFHHPNVGEKVQEL